ncbi:uncharacterized protein MYCFIDRAFT_35878 [Pseudocercospora fijiensis CIRAD86]|uniref:Uncharacterized protein n=1 Tax=Pseudocercospora fijiensis (strain CIRAD86) TaxID=383855 RepID=M2ZVD8_PSEFD|nr:uncharacterized protein MYCFIDRAFT_35878 [Pseudocercospora fijiensis CIRAD86]EME82969.1 hypothetical protein MYCFIDRAFT_35878 [Pseudocercospora fijiensis CIRAD86]
MEGDHAILRLPSESGSSDSIPERHSIKCCCGSKDCAFLRHNQTALQDLERDVCTASRIGKALLVRHETYIADSERERKAMAAQIESLEVEKHTLETQNAKAIEENRNLLDQLESLNGAVAESDTQVTNLQATLRSTQQELHKLSHLASRTEKLEQQIADFEREQAAWHSSFQEKEASEKAALRRWQEAQRTLSALQEQMDHIEQEAKEEKERHAEVVGRMERRHAVERELDNAAGRLKGAAAAKAAATGTNVVSHFVKDILQDNANLQMGIVELRDMLQTSNEEVENLRNQLSVHQPVVDALDVAQATASPKRSHLNEEMRRATAQELHVHHHYHAPSPAPKTPALRRPKKKRYGALTPGHFTPPMSGISSPRYSFSSPSNAAAILSQTAASLPDSVTPNKKRWSVQSNLTYQSLQDSSGPSSPQSTYRACSMFDRVFSDAGQDSSRPTTPDTEDPGSPLFFPVNSKRSSSTSFHSRHQSAASHRVRPSLNSILDMSTEDLHEIEQQQSSAAPIIEEEEQEWENTDSISPDEPLDAPSLLDEEITQSLNRPRTLRRATSHESILSCRGMDVNTLKSRPSQLLTSYAGRSGSSQAVVSEETAHAARPSAMSRSSNSGQSILSGMSGQPTPRQIKGDRPGIGSRVGGWMFGKWVATPTPSETATTPKINRTASATSSSTARSGEDPEATPKRPKYRPPGINTNGPIPGFGPEQKLQHSPILQRLDANALKNALGN